MKAAVFSFLAFLLSACGPFIDVNHGIVSAGVMSSTQGFSGKMKTTNGGSVAWSVVGTDSTSVPNNALGTISTVSAASNLFKTVQSNNNLKGLQNTNAAGVTKEGLNVPVKLGAQKPTITTPDQVVTFPPK